MSQLAIVLHYHDLRTSDHPALSSLANAGYEILPIFVYDEVNLRRLGGASKWWLNYAMQRLISDYKNLGHDFQLVRDDTFSVLRELVENNEMKDVSFHVSYDPDPKHRSLVKEIQDEGFALKVYSTNQIFEAGTVLNQQGNVYQVFTPFYKALKNRKDEWLDGCDELSRDFSFSNYRLSNAVALDQLELLPSIGWDSDMTEYWQPPRSAKWYWQRFLDHVQNYGSSRDIPGEFGTSHLSPYLVLGRIEPSTAICFVTEARSFRSIRAMGSSASVARIFS